MLSRSAVKLRRVTHLPQTNLMGAQQLSRGFAEGDDRFTKIACLSHYSEINCSDTYEEWEQFENYRKLYPFPKYTKQAD